MAPSPTITQTQQLMRRYASIQDAAAYAAVCPTTIRRMITGGQVRPYRAGKAIRVDLNDLDRAMARAGVRLA